MTEHTGPLLAERDGVKVYACSTCGFAHVIPLPDSATLAAYYKILFWQVSKAGWGKTYEQQRGWLDMRHGDWLEVIEQHTAGRALLDVGCGFGHFLDAARERAWQVTGIEPNEEANKAATERLLTVHQGTWEDFDYPSLPIYKFDVVSAFWLLEHLPDPTKFLRWVCKHLYTGGVLMLVTPQEFTQEIFKANEIADVHDWFVAPSHCNYFTAATLYGLLGRCGFRVVDALATYPMADWITDMDMDYTASDAVGADCHVVVRKGELEMTRTERIALGRSRARMGVGRDLVVVAVPEGQR